jgi:2-methylcitrate dehydratase PrpD
MNTQWPQRRPVSNDYKHETRFHFHHNHAQVACAAGRACLMRLDTRCIDNLVGSECIFEREHAEL